MSTSQHFPAGYVDHAADWIADCVCSYSLADDVTPADLLEQNPGANLLRHVDARFEGGLVAFAEAVR